MVARPAAAGSRCEPRADPRRIRVSDGRRPALAARRLRIFCSPQWIWRAPEGAGGRDPAPVTRWPRSVTMAATRPKPGFQYRRPRPRISRFGCPASGAGGCLAFRACGRPGRGPRTAGPGRPSVEPGSAAVDRPGHDAIQGVISLRRRWLASPPMAGARFISRDLGRIGTSPTGSGRQARSRSGTSVPA